MKIKPETYKDDQQLVLLAQKNRQAFSIIYDKYFERIYCFIYKRVQREEIAGDICQEAMLKAMFNIHKYVNRGAPFSAWLYRIASNEVNLYFRKAKRENLVSIDKKDLVSLLSEAKLDTGGQLDEQMELMIKGLNELKVEQTEIIELRFFMHYSFKEIAEFYNITEASAKMRLYRTIERLKKLCKIK